jgi:hypothetical protein
VSLIGRITVRNRPLALALAALLACLGLVSSSSASEYHPTGVFAPFADCPLDKPLVTNCIVSEEKSGEFVIGHRAVSIGIPVTLQGGYVSDEGSREDMFVGAEGGPRCRGSS